MRGYCVKTGAWVYFEDYNAYTPADLFLCGDQILIQWMTGGWTFENERGMEPTHRVSLDPRSYHHEGRGVTVVPRSCIVGELVL